MNENENEKTQELSRTPLFTLPFLIAYKLKNNSDYAVTTPYTDHSSASVMLASNRVTVKSITKELKRKLKCFFYVSSTEFYSFSLKAKDSVTVICLPPKKDAGFISDINDEQASYVCTYKHEDELDKTNQIEEEEKCVV